MYTITSLVMRLVHAFRYDDGFGFADLLAQASETEIKVFLKVLYTFEEVM